MATCRWARRYDASLFVTCLYRKSDSAVMVMKSAEDGRRYDAAHVLDGAMDRSVLVERPMSSQLIILICGILRQNPALSVLSELHQRRSEIGHCAWGSGVLHDLGPPRKQ